MAYTLSGAAQHAAQLLRTYGPQSPTYQNFMAPRRGPAEALAHRFARAQRRMFRPRCGLCGYGVGAMYAVQMEPWAAFPDVYAASARGTDYREAGLAHERAHGLTALASDTADNQVWNECVKAMIFRGQFPDGQNYGDIYGQMTWEQRFRLAQDTYAEVERRLAAGTFEAFSAQALGARTCTSTQRQDLYWTAQVVTQGLHLQRHFHALYGAGCQTRPTFDRWYGGGLRAYFTDQEQAWEEQIVPWIEVNTGMGDPYGPEDDGGGGFDPGHFLGVTWARIVEFVDAQDRFTAPSPVVSTGLRG